MAYDIYQSRFTGAKIDEYLASIPTISDDLDLIKTSYDASKIKMADGTFLPDYLTNTKFSIALSADANNILIESPSGDGYYVPKPDLQWEVNAAAPSDTSLIWFDTTDKTIKYHNGSAWVAAIAIPAGWVQSNSAPTDTAALWVDTSDPTESLIKYYDTTSSSWKQAGGGVPKISAQTGNIISNKTDGLYATINGVIKNYGSEIYSENERVVGEWINGKPLYRRVLKVMAPPTITDEVKYTFISLGLNNIDTIKGISGTVDSTNKMVNDPIYDVSNNSKILTTSVFVNNAKDYLYVRSNHTATINSEVTVIIEYTKTTDAENSFSPDMITDSENILSTDIDAAALADSASIWS